MARFGGRWMKFTEIHRKGAGPAADRYLAEFPGTARARGDRAAASPSFKGQKKQAWTQPVGWERRVLR